MTEGPCKQCRRDWCPADVKCFGDSRRPAAQVLLAGKSYEAGAALFTMSQRHPAVIGAFLENVFW